jgi:hypothetical protein
MRYATNMTLDRRLCVLAARAWHQPCALLHLAIYCHLPCEVVALRVHRPWYAAATEYESEAVEAQLAFAEAQDAYNQELQHMQKTRAGAPSP